MNYPICESLVHDQNISIDKFKEINNVDYLIYNKARDKFHGQYWRLFNEILFTFYYHNSIDIFVMQ